MPNYCRRKLLIYLPDRRTRGVPEWVVPTQVWGTSTRAQCLHFFVAGNTSTILRLSVPKREVPFRIWAQRKQGGPTNPG